MDKSERMELRRRRLERLGKWDTTQQTTVSNPQVNLNVEHKQPPVVSSNPNPNKRCGCSRSKG